MKCYSTSEKILMLLGLVAAIFLFGVVFSYTAYADEIHITWDHPGPTDLDCFELRVNGDNDTLVNIPGDVRQWTGIFAINDDNNILDMRAKDLGGQVSMWSEPCIFDPIPEIPGNIRISVVITVNVN